MSIIETAKRKVSASETIEARIKAEVEEVVRAYRHSWDVYSELIQNSVDAINRRFRILNDPDFYLYDEYRTNEDYKLETDPSYRGRLKIKIDLTQNTIWIYDNGTGVVPSNIEEFLLPKGGDKTVSQEYGFKGYGLTFVAFITQEFHFISHHFAKPDQPAHELQLNGLFDWLSDETGQINFPNSPIPDAQPSTTNLDDWNTIIKIQLANDYSVRFPAVSAAEQAINLASCGWQQAEGIPMGFEYLLRTRTAIGNTRHLFNKAPIVPIDVSLDIVLPSEQEITDFTIPYQFYHPKDHDEINVDVYEFGNYYDHIKRASSSREFRGLYHTITEVQAGTRRAIKFDVALAAISSTRLSNIEADLGLDDLESGDVNISYGIHLAIDGMPTGLRIDDWDMKGHHLKRYFVVVDAELDISNQLDPGRKGISGYYARLISNKVLDLLSTRVEDSDPFSKYAANHLNHGRGREEGGLVPQDFINKIRQVRQFEDTDQNINAELLNRLKTKSTLQRFPRDEQEVIALFYELVTHQIIKGYRTVYISGSSAPYDAALDYEIDCGAANISPNDNLGLGKVLVGELKTRGISKYVHRDMYYGRSASPELCVDFKLNLGRFLDELRHPSRTPKDPRLIDLLIFWDTDVPMSIPSTSYTLDEVRDNQRVFHSTTHRLGLIEHHNTDIFCICLKDVLRKMRIIADE